MRIERSFLSAQRCIRQATNPKLSACVAALSLCQNATGTMDCGLWNLPITLQTGKKKSQHPCQVNQSYLLPSLSLAGSMGSSSSSLVDASPECFLTLAFSSEKSVDPSNAMSPHAALSTTACNHCRWSLLYLRRLHVRQQVGMIGLDQSFKALQRKQSQKDTEHWTKSMVDNTACKRSFHEGT